MSGVHHPPAALPPAGLPGLDPRWSRLVEAADADGVRRTWHVLDSGEDGAGAGVLLCVHGNPTWSYLWRRLLAAPPAGWRVLAPDQLGMGYSERTGARRLAQRVADLAALTDALELAGPVVTVAHDWGGPISLGWALRHRQQLRGVVLANTAVQQPVGHPAPALIRLARSPALRETVCVRTPAFVRGTTALSWPPLPRGVRDAFAAPYGSAARRAAVGDFVADIPLEPGHPSAATLDRIAEGTRRLGRLPALLLWGPRDPVFGERHLRDLLDRLPRADVQRYERASHLVVEDAPEAAGHVAAWVAGLPAAGEAGEDGRPVGGRHAATARPAPGEPARPAGGVPVAPVRPALRRHSGAEPVRPLGAALTARAGDESPAVVELSGAERSVGFALLERRVRELAAGLGAAGVAPGHRVALLVPPGADLTATVYACWRAGAVVVLADAGLGAARLGRALRAAGPDHVVGVARGLAAAAALRVPGQRIAAGPVDPASRRLLAALPAAVRVRHTLTGLAALGRDRLAAGEPLPPEPDPDADCAVVFTSGATGPPKGVVYRHRQVRAQLEALRDLLGISRRDRMVAAFAPFALYGPALGIASAVPDMDVTRPATLTAAALADACGAVDATLVFASPASWRNVVATAGALTPAGRRALRRVRLALSAGAPVPMPLLREVAALLPEAELHTPYGMTEALPVTDVSLAELEKVGPGNGVCVGRPVPGVAVAVAALSEAGVADGPLSAGPDLTGEICVGAAHVKDRYDRLWAVEAASSRDPGWHRTGDVGHLDPDGRLWVEGRLAHVLTTPSGPLTPVGVECRVEELPAVVAAAVVGVGPAGTQQVVVVVVPAAPPPPKRPVLARVRLPGPLGRTPAPVLAGVELAAEVRRAAGVPVAAVLVVPALPVDVRHNSKVDRHLVAAWADRVLAGGRARP